MDEKAPQKESTSESLPQKKSPSGFRAVVQIVDVVNGFFNAVIDITRNDNVPTFSKGGFIALIAFVALFGLFIIYSVVRGISGETVLGSFIIAVIAIIAVLIIIFRFNTKKPTESIVFFVVYEKGKLQKPIKGAHIKVALPREQREAYTLEKGEAYVHVGLENINTKQRVTVEAVGYEAYSKSLVLRPKRIEIPLRATKEESNTISIGGQVVNVTLPPQFSVIQPHSSSKSTRVLIRMGDILEGGYDLTVLPCSAKGTVSSATKRHVVNYKLPMPKPMEHGSIGELVKMKLSKSPTKFIVYAASVFNDFSSKEVLLRIGKELAELSNRAPELRNIETPLLGTGAGKLDTLEAAYALREGFESVESRAILTIFVYDYPRYKEISAAFNQNDL